jgi:hypothetical protein
MLEHRVAAFSQAQPDLPAVLATLDALDQAVRLQAIGQSYGAMITPRALWNASTRLTRSRFCSCAK